MVPVVNLTHHLFPQLTVPKPVIPEKLTHDKAVQRKYIEDDRIYKFVGLDFAYHMFKGMKWARHQVSSVGVPLFMILSGQDHIVDNRKSRALFDRLTDKDKKLHVCEGLFHETFNELRRDEPIRVLKDFLKRMEG